MNSISTKASSPDNWFSTLSGTFYFTKFHRGYDIVKQFPITKLLNITLNEEISKEFIQNNTLDIPLCI